MDLQNVTLADIVVGMLTLGLIVIVLTIGAMFGLICYDKHTIRKIMFQGNFRRLHGWKWTTQMWLDRNRCPLFDIPRKAAKDPKRNLVSLAINLIHASDIVKKRDIKQKDISWMRWPAIRTAIEAALETCSILDATRMFGELVQSDVLDGWGGQATRTFVDKFSPKWKGEPEKIVTQEDWDATKQLLPHLKETDGEHWAMLAWHLERRKRLDWLAEYQLITPKKHVLMPA